MGRFGMYPLRKIFTGRPIFISEKNENNIKRILKSKRYRLCLIVGKTCRSINYERQKMGQNKDT